MLVQFTVRNVLSFKEEATFDMTAINAYKEHKSNLIDIGRKEKLLKVAAVYGANASGKSNLCVAMSLFRHIVMNSMNSYEEGDESPISEYYVPFSFDGKNENSEFQIIGIEGEIEYQYGFEYNDKEIVSEWLYAVSFDTNREKMIFEREGDEIRFGKSVRSECGIFKEQIPSETLTLTFLNKLPKLEAHIFRLVYKGIASIFVLPCSFDNDERIIKEYLPEIIDEKKGALAEFLNAIDTGIVDIKYEDTGGDILFYTYHIGKDGGSYPLSLFGESAGTIKGIQLFIHANFAISNNATTFIDELNIKLHPLLLKFIIDLFYDADSSAQLIYTTHDTTLMDKKFFRRDQIWFVEKDEFGHSKLYSLSDYKVRSDASFEKDYLGGVYGGIPFLKEFRMKVGK